MKLSRIRTTWYEISGIASTVARQLAFAGIAVVWMFRNDKAEGSIIPADLLLPLFCYSLSLFFDIMQYAYSSSVWFWLTFSYERKRKDSYRNPNIKILNWHKYPQSVLFFLKLIVVLIGYVFLSIYICRAWEIV